MKRALLLRACVSLAVLLSACATTRYEEYVPPPEEEAAAQVAPGEAASLPQEDVPDLAARVSRLEAELADRLSELQTASGDLATRVMSLSEQLEEVRKQLGAVQGSPAGEETPRSADALDLGRVYEKGLMDYNARRYAEAKERFGEVLAGDPEGDLADNALYWLGECDYALGDHRAALESIQKVFLYPKTEKADDAQLKLGLSYLRLGDRQNALIELKRLTVDHPQSEYLGRAQEMIRKLRVELEAEP